MNLPGVRLGIKKYAFYTHTHVTDKVNNEFRKKTYQNVWWPDLHYYLLGPVTPPPILLYIGPDDLHNI